MVSIAQTLRKWYENGNIDIELNFNVTYLDENIDSIDIRKENWIKLIITVMKKEFTIVKDANDDCSDNDIFRFSKSGQDQNTIVLNDCMKITTKKVN